MQPPDALLIDAMGTLITLADPVPRLVRALERRLGVAVAPDRAAGALRAEIAYYRAHMQDGVDDASLADLRARAAGELAAALGPPFDARARACPEMTAALLDALRFEPYPDAREALARVRAAGARIVVCSNWDVSLTDALEQAGLAPLLDGVVTSAAARARKPDPGIFAQALAVAGVDAGRALHVGDSLAEDVAGARAAGIEPLLLVRGDRAAANVPPGVGVIDSLAALPLVSRLGHSAAASRRLTAPDERR